MDNSLRVDPAALTDCAQQLRDTHEALRTMLSALHSAEDSLRTKWTGEAATRGTAMWTDLHDTFGSHIDGLAENADALQAAAGAYQDRDQQERTNIDRQM